MSLCPMHVLLRDAYVHHYAIPAFNFENFDVMMGVIAAAAENKSPLILQATQPAVEFLGAANMVDLVANEAAARNLPIALHLDHADNLDIIAACIRSGFTSVMVDGAELPFEQNVALTRQAIALARPHSVTVEAAIGRIGSDFTPGHQVLGTDLTDTEAAVAFLNQTGADVIAVSVGSVHGMRSKEVRLDLPRLEQINTRLGVPLTLHGSSGVTEDDLVKSVQLGICKANVETELRVAFRSSLEQALHDLPTEIKPRNIMRRVRAAVGERVTHRMKLLGCAGKAAHFKSR